MEDPLESKQTKAMRAARILKAHIETLRRGIPPEVQEERRKKGKQELRKLMRRK